MTPSPSIDGLTIPASRYLTVGLSLLLFLLIVSTAILGSVPPVDRDALTHHLFVPKLYLQHGGIYEIPEIPFSYYPMNLDLLYMIPLYFGNDIIPKYTHFLFALLTALLIYRYLNKNLNNNYALLGAIFFLSIPIIVKLSITVYVDLGVVFFSTASLLLLLHWADNNFQLRHLILAGICCGLAAGTKYNGIVSIIVLTLFVPIIFQRQAEPVKRSNRKALLYGLLFLASTITSFSPWLIRNYVWTGNPIYPLHDSLVQSLTPPQGAVIDEDSSSITLTDTLQQVTSKGSNAFISRRILYNEQWWQTLLLPVRFFIEGRDDDPRYFDGKLTPFLLLLPFLAFFYQPPQNRQRYHQKIFISFALLYFFFTFFQEAMRIRYIVPIVPPLVILSIYGLHSLQRRISPINEFVQSKSIYALSSIYLLSVTMLSFNAHYLFKQYDIVSPFPYLFGKVSRDEYITHFRPEYPVIQYANATLTPDTKVLCIFMGNRGYYMDFQPVFEQPYFSGLLSDFLTSGNETTSILNVMQRHNITKVILRDDLTISWFQQLKDEQKRRVAPLFENADQFLSNQNGHTFFEIAPK